VYACSAAPSPSIIGDPEVGAEVIAQVACGVCHTIPGIPGADGIVGPSLEGFAARTTIGGVAPNQPSVLIRWIREAPSIAPDTLMPPMPVDDGEARDVAAYLYTLR
jgi:mono/diheme cytochrome c family protein